MALALLEGEAERAVAAVAALGGQLLGGDVATGGHGLAVKTDKVEDAQVVDIGIVGGALTREIHAEIGAVGAQGMRQMRERQVVLQVELRGLTLLLEQQTDVVGLLAASFPLASGSGGVRRTRGQVPVSRFLIKKIGA